MLLPGGVTLLLARGCVNDGSPMGPRSLNVCMLHGWAWHVSSCDGCVSSEGGSISPRKGQPGLPRCHAFERKITPMHGGAKVSKKNAWVEEDLYKAVMIL